MTRNWWPCKAHTMAADAHGINHGVALCLPKYFSCSSRMVKRICNEVGIVWFLYVDGYISSLLNCVIWFYWQIKSFRFVWFIRYIDNPFHRWYCTRLNCIHFICIKQIAPTRITDNIAADLIQREVWFLVCFWFICWRSARCWFNVPLFQSVLVN